MNYHLQPIASDYKDLVGKATMHSSSSSSSSFEQMGQQIVEAEPLDALEKLNNPSLMQYSSESSSDNDVPVVPQRPVTHIPAEQQEPLFHQYRGNTSAGSSNMNSSDAPPVAESGFVMSNPMAEDTDLFVNPYAQEYVGGNAGSGRDVSRRVGGSDRAPPPPTKPKPKRNGVKKPDR